MRLKDKVCLVTGSSRGIGREIALRMAAEGADVIVNYSRSRDAAEETGEQIEAMGRRALVVQAEVTKKEDVDRMVKEAMDAFGRVDVLVNNAGGFPIKPFALVSEEEWDEVINLDLKSIFLCCKAIYGTMSSQRNGIIINMASVSGLVGAVGMVPYSAAKGGVISFTKALARELAPLHITVNAIAPGIIDTKTTFETFPAAALEAYKTYQVPLSRLGTPEDIVGLTIFLATNESAYITGQVYAVDGGFTMQ